MKSRRYFRRMSSILDDISEIFHALCANEGRSFGTGLSPKAAALIARDLDHHEVPAKQFLSDLNMDKAVLGDLVLTRDNKGYDVMFNLSGGRSKGFDIVDGMAPNSYGGLKEG